MKGPFERPIKSQFIMDNDRPEEASEISQHSSDSSLPVGSVRVVGGGIFGIQAAMDLADSGYYVYLLEREPAIGGVMSGLDKTFPTNDCSI